MKSKLARTLTILLLALLPVAHASLEPAWVEVDANFDGKPDLVAVTNLADIAFNPKGEIVGWFFKIVKGEDISKPRAAGFNLFGISLGGGNSVSVPYNGLPSLVGGPSAVIDPKLREESEAKQITYKRFPVKTFEELFRLGKPTLIELEKIRCPALVIHSRKDQVILPGSAELAVKHLASKDKRLKWFEQSGHEMFWDMERDALCETIVKFLLEHSQEKPVMATSN